MLKISQYRNKVKAWAISASFLSVFFLTLVVFFIAKNFSSAVVATDFIPGRIIDDEIFYNKDTMSVADIQKFLNNQIGSCDTWGNQPATDWGRRDITRAQFAKQQWGAEGPFVCLNNYHENPQTRETSFEKGGGSFAEGISAAQIIYDASQKNGINPQVLLVLLKKESMNLLNDTWPLKSQYTYAMGYACPDSGSNYSASCVSSKGGFYNQISLAAWQLKYYKDNAPKGIYSLNLGWNNIQYSPNPACGTKRVYIENIATLSLYIYTPYTPNDAALANYPGESECGAYGNRNFFMFFNQLFGKTTTKFAMPDGIAKRYKEINGAKGVLGRVTSEVFIGKNSIFQRFENGFIVGTEKTGYWENYGGIRKRFAELGYESGKLGLPLTGYFSITQNGTAQKYQNGFILGNEKTGYWESTGLIREKFSELGYENGKMGLPLTQEFQTVNGGWFQKYQNGFIIGSPTAGYHESYGEIRAHWGKLGYERGRLGFPVSDVIEHINVKKQEFEKGVIIGDETFGYNEIQGDVYKFYKTIIDSDKEKLGIPIESEKWIDGKWVQKFSNGFITGVGSNYSYSIY